MWLKYSVKMAIPLEEFAVRRGKFNRGKMIKLVYNIELVCKC